MHPFQLASFFAFSWLLVSCDHPSDAPLSLPASSAQPIAVQSYTLHSETIPQFRPLSGTLNSRDQAQIAAKITGTIAEIRAVVGQSVRQGDLLIRLQAEEFSARVAQAQALLDQTIRDLQRETRLAEMGASPLEQVRRLENQRNLHQAQLDEALAMLQYTKITAPFNGVITAEHLKVGYLVSPGLPILSIENPAHLQAEIDLPASLPIPPLGSLIHLAGDPSIAGPLIEIAPASDPLSRTRLIKIDLPENAPLQSGQFIRVLWPITPQAQLRIPRNARRLVGQMEQVWSIQEGRAKRIIIQSDESAKNDFLQVLSGLHPDDVIILDPPASLSEGQPVLPVQ